MTVKDLIRIFGNPATDKDEFLNKHMLLWDIPMDINAKIPALPNRLYCNKHMVVPLEQTFRELISANLHTEIVSYDGCFNIRRQRGSNVQSKHSWGIAIDLNAHLNPFIKVTSKYTIEWYRKEYVKWSNDFLDIWRKRFICGADWNSIIDGMHFELKDLG